MGQGIFLIGFVVALILLLMYDKLTKRNNR